MTAHFPILQVIIPLLAAPLCLFIRIPRIVGIFAILVSATAFFISCSLLQEVVTGGTLSYQLGGWAAPWGIEYRIDKLNGYLLLLVSGISTIVLVAAQTSISKELPENRHTFFYTAYLLCLTGLLGILATADAFNLFVFLEISALSSYTLIAIGTDRRALTASYQYLVMGTIGATFIIIGVGLMYMMTGTLNMYDLAERLPAVYESKTVLSAFGFFIVGVCLKLALFPLHLWLPNAYAYAPSITTAFLAATSTKVAVYVLIRYIFSIFGIEFVDMSLPLGDIFLFLGLTGIFVASVAAIYQLNIKRLFAYSSVAQIGYIILGLAIETELGLTATLLHLFNHALMKAAIFLAIGAVVYRIGSAQLSHYAGLGKKMPWTMAAIVAGGLSLIGVPLTVGFVSKWYLVVALLDKGWWPVAVLVLISSLIAVIYVWRVVEWIYLTPPRIITDEIKEAPMSQLIPIWILVLANIYFGVDTRLTVGVSKLAAQSLFGVN
ncbi:MAG: cation:proton antiporter [Desulfobulbaceae bacterium S3730MH12]|nr:MAG: cation:proton antiporter [Desulfobulbaceae bacterium S5133MH15]OEU58311.1 MAG: cation:proton antiporter [Desulfobulbaceae bacterium S3730MH12]OEU83516.1 MAG: cation:proton antiporter [Desulfobulbaceae bacterium C00003063]